MKDSNMKIWQQVCETDPRYTKGAKLNGQEITSISGQSVVMKATEIFGPIGIDWGYDIVTDEIIEGAPIFDKDNNQIATEKLHSVLINLWYHIDGKRGQVSQYGQTPYVRKTKFGFSTDFDVKKKSTTDALKKCLSLLGFNADIFLGMFDDLSYVQEAAAKAQLKSADDNIDEIVSQKQDFIDWRDRESAQYERIPNLPALKTVHRGHLDKLKLRCQTLGLDYEKHSEFFTKKFKERVQQMQQPTEPETKTANEGG